MEDKKNSTELEETFIKRITSILEKLPDRGKSVDAESVVEDNIKREVSTSIA